MNETPRKPPWKRKRWYVFGVLWIVLAYVSGVGPIGYALGRGWITLPTANLYVTPLEVLDDTPGLDGISDVLREYAQWWLHLGESHAA